MTMQASAIGNLKNRFIYSSVNVVIERKIRNYSVFGQRFSWIIRGHLYANQDAKGTFATVKMSKNLQIILNFTC